MLTIKLRSKMINVESRVILAVGCREDVVKQKHSFRGNQRQPYQLKQSYHGISGLVFGLITRRKLKTSFRQLTVLSSFISVWIERRLTTPLRKHNTHYKSGYNYSHIEISMDFLFNHIYQPHHPQNYDMCVVKVSQIVVRLVSLTGC